MKKLLIAAFVAACESAFSAGWSVDLENLKLAYTNGQDVEVWNFDITYKTVGTDVTTNNLVLTKKNVGAGDLDLRGLPEGNRVVYVGRTFQGDTTLTSFIEPNELQLFQDYYADYAASTDGSPTCAFQNCTALTNWVGGGSVRGSRRGSDYYDQSTFSGCSKLASPMSFPKLPCVPQNFFKDCSKLPEATFNNVPLCNYCFYQCTSLTNVTGIAWRTMMSVPDRSLYGTKLAYDLKLDEVTSIGKEAFRNSKITSVYLPKFQTIQYDAFNGCTSLTNFEGGALFTGGDTTRAFQGCTALKKLDFPSLTGIGETMFYQCTGLQELRLPKVKGVNKYGLAGCTSLTNAILGELSSVKNYSFMDTNRKLAIHVYGGNPPTFGYQTFNTPANNPSQTPCIYLHTKDADVLAAWTAKCFALNGDSARLAYWSKGVRPARTIGLINGTDSAAGTSGWVYLADGNKNSFVILVR